MARLVRAPKRSRSISYPARGPPRFRRKTGPSNFGRAGQYARLAGQGVAAMARVMPSMSAVSRALDAYQLLQTLTRRNLNLDSASKGGPKGGRQGRVRDLTYGGKYKKKIPVVNKWTRFMKEGFFTKVEVGGVTTSTKDVCYLAHSNMPGIQVMETCMKAMFKYMLKIGGIQIRSDEQTGFVPNDCHMNTILVYKTRDGNAILTHTINALPATTLHTLALAWKDWFEGLSGTNNLPGQLLRFQLIVVSMTAPGQVDVKCDLDLTSAKFELLSDSQLKIQNRTVNTAENDQEDDVDNVPLSGRSFKYATNGTIFKDYDASGVATSSLCTTNAITGLLTPGVNGASIGGSFFDEVPEAKQFVGIKEVQPLALRPGEIRTSQIKGGLTITLQKLIAVLFGKRSQVDTNGVAGNQQNQQFWIGHTRLLCYEKRLQAAVITDVSKYNLPYEHQIQIAAIFKCPQSNVTAPSFFRIQQ